MEKKGTYNFRKSIIIIAVVCAAVFSILVLSINNSSKQAISRTGQFYMQGLCEKISKHFETTIELRLEQLESVVFSISADEFSDKDELYKELEAAARACGFKYLGLISQDGDVEMIYGRELQIINKDTFLTSLNKGEIKAAMGIDSKENSALVLGVSTVYPMKNENGICTALVAGLPINYITETLSLELDDNRTYSFIIREDGSYVLRTGNESHATYFERVRDIYEDFNGKTTEQYISDLKETMRTGSEYSTEMKINGEVRQVYCQKLKHSEWYLLTFMSNNVLNQAINDFSNRCVILAILGSLVIFAAFFSILIVYLKMNKKHMAVLENARNTAESAQKKAEQASKAKSEFLSNVSHDIRTPMNAIVGMTAIAAANIDNKERVVNCLEKIELSGKHLLGLINNVLDMSKIENGKMSLNTDKVSLSELMDTMVNIIKPQIKAKKHHFDVVIHDIISENVFCDSVRLNQVMINIISNAVKFTPDGGTITVTLYQEPSKKGDEYVCVHFSIKDTGIGMTKRMQETVFDSFVREDTARVRQTEGTGLGMAITKYIIDAMGGTIEVDSELNKGTEFRVTVDFKKAKNQSEEMTLPAWRMLVVDDDKRLCESVLCYLEEMGVKADFTLDGESAIKQMEKKHNEGEDYQFVLLDWKLPSIDGIETARRIHGLLGDEVPILLVSAYDCGEIKEEALSVGIAELISKPLFKSTLYYALKKFTDTVDDGGESCFDSETRFEGKRILLAEDNELNWEIAESLLSEIGLELEWAENGKVCVEMFAASPQGYYDAVLMDIRMPEMTGYEATRAIRAMDTDYAKKIPIIAMTADAFAEDVKKCIECGMNGHAAKPIDVRSITGMLEKFFG